MNTIWNGRPSGPNRSTVRANQNDSGTTLLSSDFMRNLSGSCYSRVIIFENNLNPILKNSQNRYFGKSWSNSTGNQKIIVSNKFGRKSPNVLRISVQSQMQSEQARSRLSENYLAPQRTFRRQILRYPSLAQNLAPLRYFLHSETRDTTQKPVDPLRYFLHS